MDVDIAVMYSATGNVHALANAVADGARGEGAEVPMRRVDGRVDGLALPAAIDANPAWLAHLDAVPDVRLASLDDLRWAGGIAFGTPTRFRDVASQLKQFIDTTGPLWAEGAPAAKAVTGFTPIFNTHGGNEWTLLALYNTMYRWGAVIVRPRYTSPACTGPVGTRAAPCTRRTAARRPTPHSPLPTTREPAWRASRPRSISSARTQRIPSSRR